MNDQPDPDEAALIFANFESSLNLWEGVYEQVGEVRARPGEFSRKAARAFAEGLILDPTVGKARERMLMDRPGAVSFYEVAHEVRDLLNARPYGLPGSEWKFVHESDGRHEPFLLLASAVLNRLNYMDDIDPEEPAN